MNYNDTERLTIQAVTDYYNNNMKLFYQSLHPDTVILSVGEGQLVHGKKEILKRFKEKKELDIRYELSDIICMTQHIEPNSCFTVMDCRITTMYPNNTIDIVNQRISVVWKHIKEKQLEKEKVPSQGWYAIHIHISIAQNMNQKSNDYTHTSQVVFADRQMPEKNKIVLRDVNSCVHYVAKSQIIRVETRNRHAVAILNNHVEIIMKKKMSDLEIELGEPYIRISRKYLINPEYVEKVKNYHLYTVDGAVIHIPKENFRVIKNRIELSIEKQNRTENL